MLYPKLSCEDLYNWDSVEPGNTLIKVGMGTFVASFAKGLSIRLSTPVAAIRWSGSGGVQVVTAHEVFQARTVVVTTPIGGLQARVVTFSPSLPSAYLDAIAHLQMGTFEKIFVGFKQQVFDLPDNTWFAPYKDIIDNPLLQVKFFGGKIGVCIVGDALARDLNKGGLTAKIDYALRQFADQFGNGIRAHYQNGLASDWQNDRWTHGSYSYALPGHAAAREQLAVPLGEQIFFAGEALSKVHWATVYGAYLSGVAAAHQARGALTSG